MPNERASVTTTYREQLFNMIVKHRNMPKKKPTQRTHLFNMEAEYRELIRKIGSSAVKQNRLPKSQRVAIDGGNSLADWTPKLTIIEIFKS